MRRQLGFLGFLLAVGALIGTMAHFEPVAATELKLAHLTSPIDPVDKFLLRKTAEYVAEKSNNEFRIEIYPAGELGKEPHLQYRRAVEGTADITLGLAGYNADRFPGTLVAELPGFAPDAVVATEKLLNALDLIENEFKEVKFLSIWTSDRAVLMMREKVVRKPADVKGLTIGVLTEPQGETIAALGATPKVLPESALYRSLKTGYVDGLMITPVFLMSFDLGEVAKTFTVGPFPVTVFYLVMNREAYEKLDAQEKTLLEKATGVGMSKRARRLYKNASAHALGIEEKMGKTIVRLSPEEEKEWLEVLAPVKQKTVKRLRAEGVDVAKLFSAMGVRQ